jgi:hypothetical protein
MSSSQSCSADLAAPPVSSSSASSHSHHPALLPNTPTSRPVFKSTPTNLVFLLALNIRLASPGKRNGERLTSSCIESGSLSNPPDERE